MRRTVPRGPLLQVSVVPARLVRGPVRGSVAARCSQIRRQSSAANCGPQNARPLPSGFAGLPFRRVPCGFVRLRARGCAYGAVCRGAFGPRACCSSSILGKDKAGALVTLLLLSVPVPARSIQFFSSQYAQPRMVIFCSYRHTLQDTADTTWHKSWSWPCRHGSITAEHARNCPQSAPTAPRHTSCAGSAPPHSGAF